MLSVRFLHVIGYMCSLVLVTSVSASTTNPSVLVNTEGFQTIDDSDPSANLEIRFGDTVNEKLIYDRGNTRFRLSKTLLISGNLISTGSLLVNIGRATAGAETPLEVIGTMSGNALHVTRAFSGAGLTDCDTANTSKLLWDVTTGRFSCGSDQTGAGGGLTLTEADGTFLNQGGDGMTGSLLIKSGNPKILADAGLMLEVVGTASGRIFHAQDVLRSSGSLIIEGAAALQSTLNVAGLVTLFDDLNVIGGNVNFGAATTIGDGGDQITIDSNGTLIVNDGIINLSNQTVAVTLNSAANALNFDNNTLTIDALNNKVGIGTSTPETNLEVTTTMSGNALHITRSFSGAGLTDCDTANTSKLLWDVTTGRFSCGTDQGGSGGASISRIAGNSGAAGSDITWQNLAADSATCTTVALCTSVMTTTGVGAGTWKFKYTVIYQTAATTTGIGFGINHTGTVGQFQAMWTHITTGGAAATGIGDNDAATVAGQLAEGKHEGVINAVIGSATAGVATANADILAVIEGIIVVTASGNLELKLASEVAGSAVKIMADSTLELIKIE